jgi:trans-aconitate 2-methyltransferase
VWDAVNYQTRHSYVFQYGEALIELLDPKPGERILDLGCGAGQLTAKIAETGAEVAGIDQSAEMIEQARKNYPALRFEIGDARNFRVEQPVNAVFSNAVLHWVKEPAEAAGSIFRALKPGGRFVAEFGGRGNTRSLIRAVRDVVGAVELPWFYPSVGEYASLLEGLGFEVRFATLFDRPTHVEGQDGLEDWLVTFGGALFASIDESLRNVARRDVAGRLRATNYRDDLWTIDYRRLRVIAVKPV